MCDFHKMFVVVKESSIFDCGCISVSFKYNRLTPLQVSVLVPIPYSEYISTCSNYSTTSMLSYFYNLHDLETIQ
jgi:hypothetical protein